MCADDKYISFGRERVKEECIGLLLDFHCLELALKAAASRISGVTKQMRRSFPHPQASLKILMACEILAKRSSGHSEGLLCACDPFTSACEGELAFDVGLCECALIWLLLVSCPL